MRHLLLLLTLCCLRAGAQHFQPEPPLFIPEELAARGVDTIYMIQHDAGWEPGFPKDSDWSDTLEQYIIDLKGRVLQKTSVRQGRYKEALRYDSLGRLVARGSSKQPGLWPVLQPVPAPESYGRTERHAVKAGRDSLVTEISFWKFADGWDTAVIRTERRDRSGRLLEEWSRVNPHRSREVFDDTHMYTYHRRHVYDRNGRLLRQEHLDDNGKIYQTVRAVYDQKDPSAKDHRNLYLGPRTGPAQWQGALHYLSERGAVVLTPIEPGSRLYALRTVIDYGALPSVQYYEIQYKQGARVLQVRWKELMQLPR